jgi:hypothetical protein
LVVVKITLTMHGHMNVKPNVFVHPSVNLTAPMFVLIATELTRSDRTVEHREMRYIKAFATYEMTKELVSGWRLVSEIQKKLAGPCVPCHCKQILNNMYYATF